MHEVRRVLKLYDDSDVAPPRLAITMLREVSKAVSTSPAKYDLTTDPGKAAPLGGTPLISWPVICRSAVCGVGGLISNDSNQSGHPALGSIMASTPTPASPAAASCPCAP